MDKIIPNHIQIEVVGGICTAKCEMCTITQWKTKGRIMSNQDFEILLSKLGKYVGKQELLSLFGNGEPLLDKQLTEKIRIAKTKGFKGIGIATNCTELNETLSKDLMEAGLDTLICSIDGVKKETHESIRKGTDFDKVVNSVQKFIQMRDELNFNTKVMVRFIRQMSNMDEWPAYQTYWGARINKEKGDRILRFDVHNWTGDKDVISLEDYKTKYRDAAIKCSDLWDRLTIYADGKIGLCAGEFNDFIDLGNAFEADPVELFNGDVFYQYRQKMSEGKFFELSPCCNCTIPFCRMTRIL